MNLDINLIEFLENLSAKKVELWVDRDKLRYRAPEDVLTPTLLSQIKKYKAEIIALIRQKSINSRGTQPLLPTSKNVPLPLSFAQQRLWVISQLDPDNACYNLPIGLRIQGQLNVEFLQQSFNAIINRHEALRTNFIIQDEEPLQIIRPGGSWKLSLVDWQELSSSEQEVSWQKLVSTVVQSPFNLATESLIRGTLVQLSDTEYILLLCLHHIIADGWSKSIFMRELGTFYSSLYRGQNLRLSELPIQYADYAIWHRQWLQGDVLDSQLAYWKQQLANAPVLLSLPTDRARPPEQSFQGGHQSCALPKNLSKALKALSKKEGVTLFMTLLTAFNILLYRYAGTEDILVGSPIANRNKSEVEGLIGFFVNTLVLRTDLSGNPSYRELLARVKETTLAAYNHQSIPFELLVDALVPERDLSHTPLFQVMFALQNTPVEKMKLADLSLTPLVVENKTSKFDLTLSIETTTDGLTASWEYSTDLFDDATITRMISHFHTLLEGIVANPEQLINQLPLLTQNQQHQLLVEWNDTQFDYPQNKCIHQLFEEQVERTPDAVAVVFEGQQLTYRELNIRANQLARYLQRLGVKPEMAVGTCLDRCLEMLVGILAILKAGGAYLPLDPNYPPSRLSYMLADAGVKVLLTQSSLLESLPEHLAEVVCLDTDWQKFEQHNHQNLGSVCSDNLAYIIYTSGSTGKPKGVGIEHHSVCNLAQAQTNLFGVKQTSRILQFASISFDASVSEIFMALTSGAMLILATASKLMPSSDLKQILTQYNVTHVTLPPSALSVLPIDELPQLANIIVAGEACSTELVNQWSVGRRFFNAYGPTEATVCSTVRQISHGGEKITIGRPISNIQVYILDKYLQPVPIGVPGELYIAGDGLARGYINRPQLTSEKFITNPFKHNSKLYRTGDLARYLPDGNIEFLGRIDHQVKIRGFRIELGEIESVLNTHLQIQQAVVVAIEDTPGNKRLIAYIVTSDESLTTKQLREYLKYKLPEYMVPALFIALDTLPLTANGKVDRSALPAPDFHQELTTNFVVPRNAVEQTLALIWAEVLRIESVGVEDNFFELGGDSILGLQTIARANQAGIHLSAKQLFEHQTIAELAAVAGTNQAITAQQGLVTGSLPLTPIQHWLFEQNLPNPAQFNQSVLLEVPSDFKPEILSTVLLELVRHHDALRLRFESQDGQWRQNHAAGVESVPLKVVDLSEILTSEQSKAIEATANQLQGWLNLGKGALIQAALFHGSQQPSRLLLTIHHLVVDGVSWRILLTDLFNIYQQIIDGQTIQLPPKTSSYSDWSHRLTEYGQSAVLKTELAYWLRNEHLGYTPLPVDYPLDNEANTVAASARVSVSLSLEETRALLQSVPSAYNTQVNDVLLTALLQTFAQWTGKNSLLIDLEGHGREELFTDMDLSRTVGWFTSIFPMQLQLEDGNHPGVALKSVKEQLRRLPQRGVGYGILRYLGEKEIRQQLQTLPIPQVSFNYLGQFNQELLASSVAKLVNESPGAVQNSQARRHHLLELDGMIVDGQLQINWTYSQNVHQHETISQLAQQFIENLQTLITHCLSSDAGGYTASDFPLAKFNQEQHELVLAHLSVQAGNNKSHWRNIENIYPLSPMQEGILFHSLYTPQLGAYFEQFVCTLKGNLDIQAFEKAWLQVVARHTVLRTAFIWGISDQNLQVVYRQVPVSIKIDDCRSLTSSKQQEQLQSFLEPERKQNLPLDRAPVMRLTLLQMSDDLYQFVWQHHHLLLDGWSLSIVIQEVFSLYHQYLREEEQNLSLQAPVSYSNYIGWLQNQDIAAAETYWREKLQGFTVPTPLIFNKPSFNQQQQPTRNTIHEIPLTKETISNLKSFARKHQLTLNTLIQGSWALLLNRYSRESDVVFGVTVSGRPPNMAGVESMVGLFINTLPMRVKISQTLEVLPWLRSLQTQQVESEEYSYSFLVDIQKWSEVPQAMPLFESLVVFENYPIDTSLLDNNSGLKITDAEVIEQTNYPLTVLVNPTQEMFLKFSYDSNRFDSATITQVAQHFQTILEGMVANPEQNLLQVPMLTADERHKLLFAWNQTQESYPQDKLLHQLFEEQVFRTPDAVAVVFEDQQLTYRQLNIRANRWARYLIEQGVAAETIVPLLCDRNIDFLTAILAIFKAGGAYLPLNPQNPPERIYQVLEQSRVSLVLTTKAYSSLVSNLNPSVKSLFLTDLELSEYKSDNLPVRCNPHNLAYVIYTSGSTGKPKGAMLEHRGMLNHLYGKIKDLQLTQNDVIAQTATQTFDISIWQFMVALPIGGKVEIVPTETAADPEKLISLVQRQKISILEIVPSLFRMIINHLESGVLKPNPSTLRWLLLTGETLPPQLCRRWLEYYPSIPMLNAYGPTECSDDVTHYPIYQAPAQTSLNIPIGRPISNTQLYILDNYLQPVPIGVTGELYVAGVGVGRGYLYNLQQTEQAFIENPFGEGKLYKTGDKARYLPDGNIEFLGRIDYQVKIRGFRIELGEIESVLSNHPDVKMGAVINQTTPNGEDCIVAYFVSEKHDNLIPILRDFLKTQLPDYMIPAAFVPILNLPLTTNGKINRAALPKVDWQQIQKPYIAPRNEWETTVCSVSASLLNLEKVGINDDFWEIGGNSLLITQLVSRLQRIYQIQLPLAEVFSHRTPSELAILIKGSSGKLTTPNIKQARREKHSVNLSDDGTLIKP